MALETIDPEKIHFILEQMQMKDWAGEREKNTLKASVSCIVMMHLSKLIKFCHMTYSRQASGIWRGFLSMLWRREWTPQYEANRVAFFTK